MFLASKNIVNFEMGLLTSREKSIFLNAELRTKAWQLLIWRLLQQRNKSETIKHLTTSSILYFGFNH